MSMNLKWSLTLLIVRQSEITKEIAKYEKVLENPEMTCDIHFANEAIEGLSISNKEIQAEINYIVKNHT